MCTLENIDQLTATLEVPRNVAGVAFVRAPEVVGRNFPLLVLFAEYIAPVTRTWSLQVTADQPVTRVKIGDYPPVVPNAESGVVPVRGGVDAYLNFDNDGLAKRQVVGDRHWCGSLTMAAGGERLMEKLRNHFVLDSQLNDLTRFILNRRLGGAG